MTPNAYLWWQSAITAGLVAVLAVEAARRQGMFVGERGWVMIRVLIVVALALVVRTVWHAVLQAEKKPAASPVARTSAAVFLAALFLAILALSSRVTAAIKARTTNPLASRLTWTTALVLMALAMPVTLLGSRAALMGKAAASPLPRATLSSLADILADPNATAGPAKKVVSLLDKETDLLVYVHELSPDVDGAPATVISFQGTRTAAQALANISANTERLGGCCDVHGGYVQLFSRLRPALYNAIWAPVFGAQRLFVVGHSLGGAMAQLLVFDLPSALQQRTSLAVFGAPTIGDGPFVERINRDLDGRVANVVMPFDPIPPIDTVIGPPIAKPLVLVPARPNLLFVGAHTAKAYADALRSGTVAALAATSAFVVGLVALLVGLTALILGLKLPRLPTLLLILGAMVTTWASALRAESAASSYVILGLGIVVVIAAIGLGRFGKFPRAISRAALGKSKVPVA